MVHFTYFQIVCEKYTYRDKQRQRESWGHTKQEKDKANKEM